MTAPFDLSSIPTLLPWDRCFEGGTLGAVYGDVRPERVTAHLDVDERHLAHGGGVALGVFASLAEGTASLGTAFGFPSGDMRVSGMTNNTTLITEVTAGRVLIEARRETQEPDLWSWNVECRDGAEEICALARVLVAVRPAGPRA